MPKLLWFFCVSALAVCWSSPEARAQLVAAEYFNNNGSGGYEAGFSETTRLAQTFTARFGGRLHHVTVRILRDANLSTALVVELRETSAGVPGHQALARVVVPGTALPPSTSDIGLDFTASAAMLQEGEVYALVVGTESRPSTPYTVSGRYFSNYAEGAAFRSFDGGLSFTPADFLVDTRMAAVDLIFQVTVVPPDETAAECVVIMRDPNPPQSIRVAVQDPESGLLSIQTLSRSFATVNVPTFTTGLREPVVIVATRGGDTLWPYYPSWFEVEVINGAGIRTTSTLEVDPGPMAETCEDVLSLFDLAASASHLEAIGPAQTGSGLELCRRILTQACESFEHGKLKAGCELLEMALRGIDHSLATDSRPDIVGGPASDALVSVATRVGRTLGCQSFEKSGVPPTPEAASATWGAIKSMYRE